MAGYPFLPLATDAYLADTRHLSTVEHGAYLLLLMEAWRRPHCNLPDNDPLLARLAGLELAEWMAIRDAILAFWKLDGRSKTWTQKRLTAERMYVADVSAIRKDAATKRWNKRRKDDANAMQSVCKTDAPTPTPTPTHKTTASAVAKRRVGSRLPNDWGPDIDAVEAAGLVTQINALVPADDRKLWADDVVASFCDYWHSKTGAGATKLDWQMTFHNWLRKELKDVRQRNWSTARWQEARTGRHR